MNVSAVPGGMDRKQTAHTGSSAVSEGMTPRLRLDTGTRKRARGHQARASRPVTGSPTPNRTVSIGATAAVSLSSGSVHGASDRLPSHRHLEGGCQVPVGALVLTRTVENTIVLTKFTRRSEVEVEKMPNSGPRTPAVPGTTVPGEK